MSSDVLEKIKLLPPEKQEEIKDFIEYLLSKYNNNTPVTGEALAEMRRQNMGRFRGQIWMADDFKETPEDFKDYL